jgi:hypothetical protein
VCETRKVVWGLGLLLSVKLTTVTETEINIRLKNLHIISPAAWNGTHNWLSLLVHFEISYAWKNFGKVLPQFQCLFQGMNSKIFVLRVLKKIRFLFFYFPPHPLTLTLHTFNSMPPFTSQTCSKENCKC